MEIIDYSTKGNVIRFYLGKNGKQWGDDWDDAPFEHNAEKVYDEHVKDIEDIFVPFDSDVYTPDTGYYNSSYTKQDMIKRKIPCIAILKEEDYETNMYNFEDIIKSKKAKLYYFGDKLN